MSQPLSPDAPPISRRAERRLATTEEIKELARRQLAEQGPGALSMRAIARQMRMAPSALYRYFASYEELISVLCVDAYDSVADALEDARDTRPDGDHAGRWWALCHAYRGWALRNRHDFALIFGTPLPGYQAPEPVTGPAAGRFVAVQLDVLTGAVQAGAIDLDRTPMSDTVEVGPLLRDLLQHGGWDCPPRLAAIGLNAWASILGFLVAEVFGSLSRLIGDTDELFQTHARTVMVGLGFHPDLIEAVAPD